MVNDFFLGFAGHAHTKNNLIFDPNGGRELRERNSPEEAMRLTEAVQDKLGIDISNAGYDLKDVKLLVLYLSYRGETEEKDRLICESILKTIDKRFKGHTAENQLRLIGHTTCGEIENEDLELKEVSGIGHNGLSLLALVTNLPIGVGRTWGVRTAKEAAEHGREMAHDAWVDFHQSTDLKEHLQKGKTLLVLAQGPTPITSGWLHFLGEGISNFVNSTHEARISNVIGGGTGDDLSRGIRGFGHQFYGKLGKKSEFKILDAEAVCALIPNLSEPSVGLDVAPTKRIGGSHTFHFDPVVEPQFIHVKRIDNLDARELYAKIVFDNEVQISREKGLSIDEKELFKSISEMEGIPYHPILGKYGFAFPFGNYAPVCPMKVRGQDVEMLRPVRNYEPKMAGYFIQVVPELIQKGAHKVYDMLRENRGFSENDVTFLFSCLVRRVIEMAAGCTKTEAEILKESFSSTQMMGFLSGTELSFSHLLQEPYVYNWSCWGMTLRSVTGKEDTQREARSAPAKKETYRRTVERKRTGRKESRLTGKLTSHKAISKPEPMEEISEEILRHVVRWRADLDKLLHGGITSDYAVVLTSPSCIERDSLVKSFLETGAKNGEVTFFVTIDPSVGKPLAEELHSNFYLFVCNPEADAIIKDLPNVFKMKGVENLIDISIALTTAIRKLDPTLKGPRRICLGLVSDVLLQHHAVETRRWLTALMTKLKSEGFTILAVIDPKIHPSEELHAVLGLFDGEINIYQKEAKKFLKINRMSNQKYLENELPLRRENPE